MSHFLPHEKLVAYTLTRDVARRLRHEAQFPRGESNLKDQAQRAADSAVLNLAEGCYRTGKDRQYHFRVTMGSAAECCAVPDLVEIVGAAPRQRDLRRAVAAIRGLR